MSKEEINTKEVVLKGKIEEVENKTLHENWIAWYNRRKGISESMNKTCSKMMLNGLIKDFYSVCEYYQNKIKELENKTNI